MEEDGRLLHHLRAEMLKSPGKAAVLAAAGKLDDGGKLVVVGRVVLQPLALLQTNPADEQIPQVLPFKSSHLRRCAAGDGPAPSEWHLPLAR